MTGGVPTGVHNAVKKFKVFSKVFIHVANGAEEADDAESGNREQVMELCLYLLYDSLNFMGCAADVPHSLPSLLPPLREKIRRHKSPFCALLLDKVDHIIRSTVS